MKKFLPGFIPIIILIIAGIIIAGAGGTYIVRKQFVKKGQSGKAALDEKKISEQLKNPIPLEAPSPDPTLQLAPSQYQYEPEKTSDSEKDGQEPGFTINPPSGWSQKSSASVKIGFLAPQQDEEPAEPPLVYMYTASIQIVVNKHPQLATLQQAADATIDGYKKDESNVQVISNSPTSFAGQDARVIELTAELTEGHKIRVINYVIVKNGYTVGVGGIALDSAWSKRSGTLNASINSFKFTD